jgi:transposase
MGQFVTHQHLASWAGLCPGNNESAGKRRSGRTAHGNVWLRSALVQAAWAATRAKGTYLSAQYRRLVRRCGKKKALVGVAHSLLVMCYHVLKKGEAYRSWARTIWRSWARSSGRGSWCAGWKAWVIR